MMPETPRSTADLRAARSCNPWLQMTDTPGPKAIRASRASEVTAIMPPGMQLPPLNRLFVPQRVGNVNLVTPPTPCRITCSETSRVRCFLHVIDPCGPKQPPSPPYWL